jgi:opine dehydrogenase
MHAEAVGIVGAGQSAHALAAYLARQGHAVTIYARNPGKLAHLAATRVVQATGQVEGAFPIQAVTGDPATLAGACRTIFIATVTTAYPDVARTLAPHLTRDHVLVPFSSKLCGSLAIANALAAAGAPAVPIVETDALFACRLTGDASIWIRGLKGWNLYACPRQSETLEFGGILRRYFPGLEPARNLVHRGLTDFGAVAHAVITLANISRIDRQDEFLFYYEGLSERTIVLLERMEAEFRAVAAAYDVELMPMKELLKRYYGCDDSSLYRAMTTVPNYRHSLAPKTLDHRYMQEDVACTLVPLRELARKAGLETPLVDAVISVASVLAGQDYKAVGRHLGRLGCEGMSRQEILDWMAA